MFADPKTATSTAPEGLLLIPARMEGGLIVPEPGVERVAADVAAGWVVILKGALPPQRLIEYRRLLMRWSAENSPYPNGVSPSTTPEVNYHRIDTAEYASSLPHVFHQYGLNSPSTLPGELGRETEWIARAMLRLQNAVGGTALELSPSGMRAKILHYPRGGGYLAEHSHPIEPQRVGLIASMSRAGTDFSRGGTTFETPFGLVDTTSWHDLGDIVLFRYDLPHAVTAVDEDEMIDWAAETGKWSFVLDLRETHSQSQTR